MLLRRLLLLLAFALAVAVGFDGASLAPFATDVACADDAEADGCDCCDEAEDCCASGSACPCVHGGPVVAHEGTRPAASTGPILLLVAWNLDTEPAAHDRGSPPPTPPPIG